MLELWFWIGVDVGEAQGKLSTKPGYFQNLAGCSVAKCLVLPVFRLPI